MISPLPVHNAGLTRQSVCSCGTAEWHRVAQRAMYDGAVLVCWSDGQLVVTDDQGITRYCRTSTVGALWRVADAAALYDARQLFAAVHWSSAEFRTRAEVELRLERARRRAWGL